MSHTLIASLIIAIEIKFTKIEFELKPSEFYFRRSEYSLWLVLWEGGGDGERTGIASIAIGCLIRSVMMSLPSWSIFRTGYPALDELLKKPQPLRFIFHLLKVLQPEDYEAESWQLEPEEKLASVSQLKQAGNESFKQVNWIFSSYLMGWCYLIKEKQTEIADLKFAFLIPSLI